MGLPKTTPGDKFKDSAMITTVPASGGVSSPLVGGHVALRFSLIVSGVWAPFCHQGPSKGGLMETNSMDKSQGM